MLTEYNGCQRELCKKPNNLSDFFRVVVIKQSLVRDNRKNLFEQFVADGDQRQFFILSFRYQPLIQLFTGKVTLDGAERAHV